MSSLNCWPAIFILFDFTAPPTDIIDISVDPPPILIIRLAIASSTGSLIPIAEAIGSSTSKTFEAPAEITASSTDFLSTSVRFVGIVIAAKRYLVIKLFPLACFRKCFNISSVISKSDITPFIRGFTRVTCAGTLSSIFFASSPIASICSVLLFTATRVG